MKRLNKFRIGIITHNYPAVSSERKDAGIFIHDFAHELAKKCKVYVLSPDFRGKKEKYKKVPVSWFDWGGKGEKFGDWQLFSPLSVLKFIRLIFAGCKATVEFRRKNKIDFVLACWALPSGIFAFYLKLIDKTPYAVWSLGSDLNKYSQIPVLREFIKASLRNAKTRFANSYLLCKKGEVLVNKKFEFMPAITDFKAVSGRLEKKDKTFRFLFVGRLEKVKGPDILLEAVESLVNEKKKFRVDFLGDGTLRKELSEKARNLKDVVSFYGWADEKTVSKFMSLADCLVIPSRSESLPIVLIEAGKKNLPVIASQVGDCERVVKKYGIGMAVEAQNPKMLAKAMVKMMSSKKIARRSGFKRLSDDFSQKRAIEIFLSKYGTN